MALSDSAEPLAQELPGGLGQPKASPVREGELPPTSSCALAGGSPGKATVQSSKPYRSGVSLHAPGCPVAGTWVPGQFKVGDKEEQWCGSVKNVTWTALCLQVDRDPFQRCLG